MRFWRVGSISPELKVEITKSIEKDYYENLKQDDGTHKKAPKKQPKLPDKKPPSRS